MQNRLFVGTLCGTVLASGIALAQVVSVVTNPQGTLGYRTGIAVAKVVTSKTRVTARAQPMAGSSTYLPMLNRGEIHFGFTNGGELQHAAAGIKTFAGKKQADLRTIGVMFPLRSGVAVVGNTGLIKIADLQRFKGKRAPTKYTSLAIIQDFIAAGMANGGVSYKDFKGVPVSGLAKGALALGQGKVDLAWVPVGSGLAKKINNQLRNSGGMRYLDLDPSPTALSRFKEVAPALRLRLIKNTKIAGIKKPTHVAEMDYIMLTGKSTKEKLVYTVTKALIQHQEDLGKAFGAFKRNKVNQMGMVKETPYHPGAIRALREAGIKVHK